MGGEGGGRHRGGAGNGVVGGVGAPRGVVLGPVGGRMQGSERWDALAVGYPRADRDWGRGSAWVGNGAVVGQRGHHGHDNDNDVVVLHGAGRAPPWVRHQVLAWGRQVQVWVWVGAPARWRWDNGIVVVVEGAVGVFRWPWGVSGEGGVLDLLSGPCPLLFPLCTLFSSFSVLTQGGRRPVGRALWLCEGVVEGVHD